MSIITLHSAKAAWSKSYHLGLTLGWSAVQILPDLHVFLDTSFLMKWFVKKDFFFTSPKRFGL